MEILLIPGLTFIVPDYPPFTKEQKAHHKKQIVDGIKKDRFKYASR